MDNFFKLEDMKLDITAGERVVSGHNTIIHCHHYNSRIQKTIEGADLIDGKDIFRSAAAITFGNQACQAIQQHKLEDTDKKLKLVSDLYSFLGFGVIDFKQLSENQVFQTSSHFVEGWKSSLGESEKMVCTFTEGFLEGVLFAVTGKGYRVREVECMALGAERCSFSVEEVEEKPSINYRKNEIPQFMQAINQSTCKMETKVDMEGITEAVFGMPLTSNELGIIPAFNVYLSHMPRDFYNLVSREFIAKMELIGMREVACDLLKEDAENCGLNTFSGIMNSEEWAALIQPMIETTEDNLYGLVAVANALGWGKTQIVSHTPYEELQIRTTNGYEAVGGFQIFGASGAEDCAMLSGVTAGIMALIYGSGDFSGRSGVFSTVETECYSSGASHCFFKTTLANKNKNGNVA